MRVSTVAYTAWLPRRVLLPVVERRAQVLDGGCLLLRLGLAVEQREVCRSQNLLGIVVAQVRQGYIVSQREPSSCS